MATDALCRVYIFHVGSSNRSSVNSSTFSTSSITAALGHHMDLQDLDQAVQRYLATGLMPITHKAYL